MIVYESFQEMAAELRSLRSNEKCYVRFINKTRRAIDIMWIDFTGQFVKYKLLQHGEFVDINTYKTHPWFAVDSITNDNMLLNKAFTYLPRTPMEILQDHPVNRHAVPLRTAVLITIPLYSLLYRCLLELRDRLKNEDDVDSLEITKQLKQDLKKLMRDKNQRNIANINTGHNT